VRHATIVVVFVVLIAGLSAPPAVAQSVRGLTTIHAALMAEGIAELERQNGLMQEIWARLDAGSAAMVDAQRQGTDLDALRTREDQLQELESQLLMRLFEVQRVRRDVFAHLAVIEAAGVLGAQASDEFGVLDGPWDITVQPGLTGKIFLVQQGTLVSGTYELSGGWTGSLRGTLVANKVRLERIDSQLGFAAIFYGELNVGAEPNVIRGRWEATQLATGMPSAGGWRAIRSD
jgi:hypothetical protein